MIHIKPCSFSDIAPYLELARRERIGVTPNTTFYLARYNSEPAGFCGIAFKKDYAVLKNIWVKPEFRRKGIGKTIIQYQIKTAKTNGCSFARAFCTPMSLNIFLKNGATVVREYKYSTTVEIRFK